MDRKFSVIGITLPGEFPGGFKMEAERISALLKSGAIDLMHIRKSETTLHYTEALLDALPTEYFPQIVLHSHFELWGKYPVGGIHVKGNQDIEEKLADAKRSRSCHSLDELRSSHEAYTYSFLSPVYDSISKKGYKAAVDLESEKLKEVLKEVPTIALGGVRPEKFSQLFALKFAGAALLGYLWTQNTLEETITSLLEARKRLKEKG